GTGLGVGQAAMGHAQQRPTRLIDQVDLDQTRSWRRLVAPLPAEAVCQAVDGDDLREPAAGDVLTGDVDEIEPAAVRLHRRLRTHPAQDLFWIGEERENGRGRGPDLDLTPDHERFGHRNPPPAKAQCSASGAVFETGRMGNYLLMRESTFA